MIRLGGNSRERSILSDNRQSLLLEIKSFRFINKENGFFIASGKSAQEQVNVPLQWRSHFKKENITIKGSSLSLASLKNVGSLVECRGEWIFDPKFGLQFDFSSVREAMPSTIEALQTYLSSGKITGIGPSIAKIMVEKWGLDTLNILDNHIEKLTEIPGLTEQKVQNIKKIWEQKRSLYNLTSFFGLYGIGEIWIPRIIDVLKEDGLEARIRANPYILTAIDGIGFSTADKMALNLGFDLTSHLRSEAMLQHLINEYTLKQGHTACPIDEWLIQASEQLKQPMKSLQPIAQNLINEKKVVLRQLPVSIEALRDPEQFYNGGNRPDLVSCVSLKKDFFHEKSIASDLERLMHEPRESSQMDQMKINKFLSVLSKKLDVSQLESVEEVFKYGVSILTGGPGTGKTTTLKSIIDIAEDLGKKVVLAAPTGRAAKRMTEAIGRSAATLHRTLKYSPKEGFLYNEHNKLHGDLFIVDESSMLDNALACSWLKAIPTHAQVIFVGDVDQLPSVGPGAFLKDIMESQFIHICRLTKVHRQSEGSMIGEAAQRILNGFLPELNTDPWTDDFAFLSSPSSVHSSEVNVFIRDKIKELVKGFLKKGFTKSDIQVLSPQKDGIVGVLELNLMLREFLNEKNKKEPHEDDVFCLGDRVLITKNNYEKEIFNGDMGIIQNMDENSIELKMEDDKTVVLEGQERKILTLGYAITVHKSQGGERPVILMACSPSHTYSLNKNLIYTAITRGKNKVVLVGSSKTLNVALHKHEKMYRITGLKQELEKKWKANLNNSKVKLS